MPARGLQVIKSLLPPEPAFSSPVRRNQLKAEAATLHHTQLGFLLFTKCSLFSGTELSPPKVTGLRKGHEPLNLNYFIQHTERIGSIQFK